MEEDQKFSLVEKYYSFPVLDLYQATLLNKFFSMIWQPCSKTIEFCCALCSAESCERKGRKITFLKLGPACSKFQILKLSELEKLLRHVV